MLLLWKRWKYIHWFTLGKVLFDMLGTVYVLCPLHIWNVFRFLLSLALQGPREATVRRLTLQPQQYWQLPSLSFWFRRNNEDISQRNNLSYTRQGKLKANTRIYLTFKGLQSWLKYDKPSSTLYCSRISISVVE